ncbi:MAG: UDP-N-acetylmuramoyl-tripeptide--D-alanyl-D-alanine ligase [Bacteroidetes bacterium]|nr:UDP-N-acetylmuramoyl-tripeptide--D-alanyl-D-alanine ligase [Bacteroidota bacterium]
MKLHQLHALFLKSNGVCTDTRNLAAGELFFALKGPSFNANDFALQALEKGAIGAVVDSYFEEDHANLIKVPDPLNMLQKLANYHRNTFTIPVLGLTGSNGKTTTKELISLVLGQKFKTLTTKGNLNNHIGVPLTLLGLNPSHEIAVIEMGANHQGEIALLASIAEPTHGLITNFGKAHLAGFGGIQGIIKGKQELYQNLFAKKGVIFYNEKDPIQVEALKGHSSKIPYQVGKSQPSKNKNTLELLQESPRLMLRYKGLEMQSQLFGVYNASNIAAAVAIGDYFEVPLGLAAEAISSYIPSNMRSEILEINGQRILLDAYNANPSSMESAIRFFKSLDWHNKALILGDMFELGEDAAEEHQKIVDLLQELSFKHVCLVGSHFAHTESTFETFHSTDELLAQFPPALRSSELLVKGSRGMALERLLDKLK